MEVDILFTENHFSYSIIYSLIDGQYFQFILNKFKIKY